MRSPENQKAELTAFGSMNYSERATMSTHSDFHLSRLSTVVKLFSGAFSGEMDVYRVSIRPEVGTSAARKNVPVEAYLAGAANGDSAGHPHKGEEIVEGIRVHRPDSTRGNLSPQPLSCPRRAIWRKHSFRAP